MYGTTYVLHQSFILQPLPSPLTELL